MTPANDNFHVPRNGRPARLPDCWTQFQSTAQTRFGAIGRDGQGNFIYLEDLA